MQKNNTSDPASRDSYLAGSVYFETLNAQMALRVSGKWSIMYKDIDCNDTDRPTYNDR